MLKFCGTSWGIFFIYRYIRTLHFRRRVVVGFTSQFKFRVQTKQRQPLPGASFVSTPPRRPQHTYFCDEVYLYIYILIYINKKNNDTMQRESKLQCLSHILSEF